MVRGLFLCLWRLWPAGSFRFRTYLGVSFHPQVEDSATMNMIAVRKDLGFRARRAGHREDSTVQVQSRSPLRRYGVMALAVAVSFASKLLLTSVEKESAFIFFLGGVLVSAWYGGRGPGLVATVLSVPLIDFFFLEPIYTFDFGWASGHTLNLFVLFGEGIVISLLVGSLYAAQEMAKARARELQASQERYRRIVETAHEGIWGRDSAGCIEYVNPRMTQLLGYTVPEMLGRPWWDFLAPHDRLVAQSSWEHRRRGVTQQFEFHFQRKDGSDLFAIVSANPIFDQGTFIGALGMLTDVTQRKQAEEELRRAKEELEVKVAERTTELQKTNARLQVELAERRRAEEELQRSAAEIQDLYDHAPCGYYSLDPDGLLIRINNTELTWLGYTREEILGRKLTDLVTPESARQFQEIFPVFKERGWIRDLELNMVRKDGTSLPVLANATAICDAAGRFLKGRLTTVDLSERKRSEDELQRAKEAAEAANRAKSDFLANVSHEIRNPMNAILVTTDLLVETELTAKQTEYLHMMKTSAHSLLRVINDLLDFSKIEAGKLTLDAIPFNLDDRFGRVLKPQALRAHQKGLELACALDPKVPDILIGDPNRLGQIITNLVSNAVKFTERGEVVVRVEVASRTADQIELHVAVRDTGIGIPADKLQVIFQPFEQVDRSTTRKYGGTGLGLSIAAKLVALMGGHTWVESELGQGSTFHFTARFEVGQNLVGGLAQVRLASLRDVPVLVVDDSATSRQILAEALQHWHMRPTAVGGAQAALEALRQAAAVGTPFPLVLADAHMPDRDGFALAAALREHPELTRGIVLMLSSTDGPDQVARCHELGVTCWISKPILPSELRDILLSALRQPSGEATSGPPSLSSASGHSLRVLVTEDNLISQILLVDLLEKLGHTVVAASSGPEALDTLEKQPFDVVLMDVQMPMMSGFEVTAQIRAREKATGKHVAIIAVTAYAMQGDRERCLQAGMDDYLTKPLQVADLMAALGRLMPASAESSQSPGGGSQGLLW
jgi:PAS domain S-box-containing protein